MSETSVVGGSAINGEVYEDAVDRLIEMLKAEFPDIRWDRDALDMNSAEETGAVEMSGQAAGEWADGHLIDAAWGIDIWICIQGSGAEIIYRMADVLRVFDEDVACVTWNMPERHFLYDVGKVVWRWKVNMWDVYLNPEESAEEDG